MKPSGLCSKCKHINKCVVDTQTMAKVIECVYRQDFDKKDLLGQRKQIEPKRFIEENTPKTEQNQRVKKQLNPKKESSEPLAYKEWMKYKCLFMLSQ